MEYNYSERDLDQLGNRHAGTTNLYIGIRKNVKNAKIILARIEEAYITAQNDGTVKAAFARYTKK